MNNRRYTIKMNEILCILTFIPLLKMGSFSVLFPNVDTIFDVFKVIDLFILGVVVGLKSIHKDRFVIDNIFLLTMLYIVFIIVTTAVNGGNMFYTIVYCAGLLLIYFWIYLFYRIQKLNLRYIIFLFAVVMLIDIIMKIFHPTGLYVSYTSTGSWMSNENWFLGYKNNYFPIIGFGYLLVCEQEKNKNRYSIRLVLFYLLCLVEVLYVSQSSTSIIAALLILFYYLIRKVRFLQSNKIILIYFALNFAVLFLFVIPASNNEIFLWIGRFFGKNYSVNARFILWNKSIEAFFKSPIWGLGLSEGNPNHPLANWNSHNRYLWSLATGGILGSLILIALIIAIAKRLYHNYSNEYVHFLGWLLFTILVTWQFEVYANVAMFIYGILLIIYYSCPNVSKR